MPFRAVVKVPLGSLSQALLAIHTSIYSFYRPSEGRPCARARKVIGTMPFLMKVRIVLVLNPLRAAP